MRLTLRTLLAYHDDQHMSESNRDQVTASLEENQSSREILERIETLAAQPRMAAPNVHVAGTLDPNNVAQYIDNSLAAELCPQFERSCLKSDSALAEIAATHQIVCRMAEQPADIPPRLRDRIYQTPVELKSVTQPKSTEPTSELTTQPAVPVEPRSMGRKALASAANALSGIADTFGAKEVSSQNSSPEESAAVEKVETVSKTRLTVEDKDETPASYGRWIILAIVLLLWLTVWLNFPKIQGSGWYQKIAGRPGNNSSAGETTGSNSTDTLDLLARQPKFSSPTNALTTPDATAANSSEPQSQTPAAYSAPSPLPPPSVDIKFQPSVTSPKLTAQTTLSQPNLDSPISTSSPLANSPFPAASITPKNASDSPIQAPELPTLLAENEPISAVEMNVPSLANNDIDSTTTGSEIDNAIQSDPVEMAQVNPQLPAASLPTTEQSPNSTAFPPTLPAPTLPTATTLNEEVASYDSPHNNPLTNNLAADTKPYPNSSAEQIVDKVTESPANATIASDAPASDQSETQLATAVRDLPPVTEEPETAAATAAITNTALTPLAPAGLQNSEQTGEPQPVKNPLVPNPPINPTADASKSTGGVTFSQASEVAAPNLSKENDSVIQLEQQTAMVAVDQHWSLVLPGGIGKLKAKGITGDWNLIFSGVSKLAATEKQSEPDIRVERCFVLIQNQTANETLRIRTPKGDLFLTALKPNSELVVEIRPYLPPGFTAAETQTRYMLGCLGVAGTFVVEHNQKEQALSQNDWLVVDTNGKANQLHEPLPADIMQSIEYLKKGEPLPHVAELASMLASPYGLTMLTDFASGDSTSGGSDPQQISKRSLAGIWSYYLGRMEPIAHILNDPAMRNENDWNDHIDAVRDCLQSEPSALGQLQSAVGDLWNDEQLAGRIVGYQAQTMKATTMSSLVDDLSNPGLARRVLAIHALQQLWQKDFGYDPMGETDSFKAAITQWRQLLEDSLSSRIGVSPAPSLVPSTQR